MSFLSKLFGKKTAEEHKIGGMEDYMTLIRVYFQAALAAQLGITNLAMLPDLRTYKQKLHVATVNNKLGVGERNHCKKMLQSLYNTGDDFFKEIDQMEKTKIDVTQYNQTKDEHLPFLITAVAALALQILLSLTYFKTTP